MCCFCALNSSSPPTHFTRAPPSHATWLMILHASELATELFDEVQSPRCTFAISIATASYQCGRVTCMHGIKVSRGNSECRIIRNGSGIDLGYYKTTDRLDILFHHKVAAGVGFIISTSFAAGRCPSQRRAKKC